MNPAIGLATASHRLAVGAGAVQPEGNGTPRVNVYDTSGTLIASFYAFDPAFALGVHVAVGDVNGDGIPDIIVAQGFASSAEIKVIDGTKLSILDANGEIDKAALLADFFAYDPRFQGGAYVAFAQSNGLPEIIAGAGPSGGPHVKVIDATKLRDLQPNGEIADSALVAQFYAYNPFFAGGVLVASADLNNDGIPDIVTGAGPGGGPHVKVIDATKLKQLQNNAEIADSALIGQFYAYAPTWVGGVNVAASNNNGHPIVVMGPGGETFVFPNTGPEVKVIDATKLSVLDNNSEPTGQALVSDFLAYDPGVVIPVRVAIFDFNGDGMADIVVGPGPAVPLPVKIIDGTKLMDLQPNREIADSALLRSFLPFGSNLADSNTIDGVFVGAG
jgi:hypothetical protein